MPSRGGKAIVDYIAVKKEFMRFVTATREENRAGNKAAITIWC